MKLWISDDKKPTHRLVRFNAEEHSELDYLGDLSDDEIRDFFRSVDASMDIEKNLEAIHYFGYLPLFVAAKKS